MSAELSTAGLVHALPMAPRPWQAGGAVGKAWTSPAPNAPMRAIRHAHSATLAGSAGDGKGAYSTIASSFCRAALAQPCHLGRPIACA